MNDHLSRAIFAGGCFWCTEAELQELDGVKIVTSGYTGGDVDNPTYEQVSSGSTGHAEAVEVLFDPALISYEKILDVYWSNIDPTDAGGQFHDRGSQYRTAIFWLNDEQKAAAEASKAAKEAMLGRPVATTIEPASAFYPAEDYHQDFYQTTPLRYQSYKLGSGRERKLKEIWESE